MSKLEIIDLKVEVEGNKILKGINLEIKKGKIYALMGPNGSGKSTLSNTLMGHPKYKVTSGKILLDGKNISDLPPNERSKLGLFLSFQNPQEIPGITLSNFLRIACNAHRTEPYNVVEFHKLLKEKMKELGINPAFSRRSINEGFSGGEKKKAEILQMAMIKPKYAILDETDSGLDVDSLRIVSEGINKLKSDDLGILLITHYTRILQHIEPDVVFIMKDGKIMRTGGKELAHEIESKGYN